MKTVDYGHLMLDLQTKDFLEDVCKERRNKNDDLILDKIDAVWRFRYDRNMSRSQVFVSPISIMLIDATAEAITYRQNL